MLKTMYHGTDDPRGAEAFLQKKLAGLHPDELAVDTRFTENVVFLTDSRRTALRYAKYALITLEVDEDDLEQTSDVEYVMPISADYDVVEVEYFDDDNPEFTMTRIGGAR